MSVGDEDKPRCGAGTLMLGAARIRAEAMAGPTDCPFDLQRADNFEFRVREPLSERRAELGAGGELVPHNLGTLPGADFRSTLQKPDYVAAAASRDRLDLAHEAGVLEVALDTADTIEARNSVEQMLAHQLASLHRSSLKMSAQLNRQIDRMNVLADGPRQLANVEGTRLANTVAKLMTTFQQGALTMQRLRTGGRQIVTVQHVNVGPGGQAIVAGEMTAGGGPNDQEGVGCKK